MITIHSCNNLDYYEREVIEGLAEYLDEGGRAPGMWVGRLAAAEGLTGPADRDDLAKAFDLQHPNGGPLTSSRIRNAGFDVTLSPPKSVSILWGLGNNEDSNAVFQSVVAARQSVESYLELAACAVRRGKGGAVVEPGTGFLGAVFAHKTSRLGDPGLHLHWTIFNVAQGPDGRRTALHGRLLHEHRYTAEAIFQSVLRHQLTHRLGVEFGVPDRHGAAEIVGVPKEVRNAFSQRRTEIVAELNRRGASSGQAARIAALTTRKPKLKGITEPRLRALWLEGARDLGFDISEIPRHRRPVAFEVSDDALAFALTKDHAAFGHQAVVRAVAANARSGTTLDQILDRADRFIASDTTIRLAAGLWTTTEMIRLERRVLMVSQTSPTAMRVPADVAEQVIGRRPSLSGEQAAIVRGVCRSGQPVETIVGAAGTGKTFAMDAIREAYQSSGGRLLGVCTSAAAARELEDRTSIPSFTASRMRANLYVKRFELGPGDVLLVDEAGMMSTRDLDSLVCHAHGCGAKSVLIGDPRQLPPIEAGGIFNTLARQSGALRLSENRRQLDPDERRAAAAIRERDAAAAVEQLDRNGRITTAPNADQLRDRMVLDWYRHRRGEADALMGALRRSDVRDLNLRAHAVLDLHGHLGTHILTVDDQHFSIGDEILATKNAYDIGILNGDTASINGLRDGHLSVTTSRGHGLELPLDYVSEHVQHAYARTVHKTQGLTCDVALILGGDNLFNELGYTGLTRGRHRNHLYAVAADSEAPLDHIVEALGASRAKQAAHDLAPAHVTQSQGLDLGIE